MLVIWSARALTPRSPMFPFASPPFSPLRPPTITAPANQNITTTNSTGVAFKLLTPASTTCGQPNCTVTILFNGAVYRVNDTVQLPPGANNLTYVCGVGPAH